MGRPDSVSCSHLEQLVPGGIDGSVKLAPTALDTNAGLIHTPGLMGWLEMTAQPRLQFGTVALDPAPDCHVVRFQAAVAEQFFDIAERERAPQLPTHGAKNQFGLGLAPLEHRRAHRLFHDLFRLPAAVGQSGNTALVTVRSFPMESRQQYVPNGQRCASPDPPTRWGPRSAPARHRCRRRPRLHHSERPSLPFAHAVECVVRPSGC